MPARAKRSLTEQLEELEAFKEGVLGLVQKYFGRKRTKVPKKRNGVDTSKAGWAREETLSD